MKLKVLLITGKVTKEHSPRVNGMLKQLLEATGRFSVKVTEEFRGATDATLEGYDALLINYDGKDWPNDDNPPLWGKSAEQAIFNFVRQGKGAVFYHSSIWCDPGWPEEYRKLMGGYVSMDNYGRRNPRGDFPVTVVPGHPITEGVPPMWDTLGEDLFTGLQWHPQADIEVLATAFDDIEAYREANFPAPHQAAMVPEGGLEALPGVDEDTPVMWLNRYGEGRVFVCSIGHYIETIRRRPFCALFTRGVEWAGSGEVTIPVIASTGEERLLDWPYYDGTTSA